MRPLANIDVQLVTDLDTASEMATWLSSLDRVAIDTETQGLSPETDDVRLISFGDEDISYVVPLEGVTYDLVPRVPQARGWGGFAVDMLRRISEDPNGPQIDMHNATYDHSMIAHTLDVRLPRNRIDDTRLMLHVMDSRSPLGLKPASARFVDPNAALGQEILSDTMKANGWDWGSVPIGFKPYWFYSGLDSCLTARLSRYCRPKVLADAPESYALEMSVSWPYEDMERRGVLIDRPYTERFNEQLTDYVKQIEAWCQEKFSIYPGSDSKVIERLLADGVDLTKRTPSGAKFSLDKEVISGLDHPLAKAVLARRQAMKINSYLVSYLKFAGDDDLIHPSINSIGGMASSPFESGGSGIGVRTGRSSMSSPNLQQVPTRTSEGAKVRRCFVPRPGHTWVSIDAEQIESRVLAHLSQDPGLIEAFHSDGDFFVNIARRLYSEPDFEKSDPRRSLVKNTTYGKVYGAGPDKLARTAGVPVEVAREFTASYDAMFPGVPTFIRSVERLAYARLTDEGGAYVRSPLTGRKLKADSRRVYTVVNYLIQGMAAEILKLKITQAAHAGLDRYMLYPVHDELNLDVPNEEAAGVIETLQDVMNDDKLLSVPITWSVGKGANWAEAH